MPLLDQKRKSTAPAAVRAGTGHMQTAALFVMPILESDDVPIQLARVVPDILMPIRPTMPPAAVLSTVSKQAQGSAHNLIICLEHMKSPIIHDVAMLNAQLAHRDVPSMACVCSASNYVCWMGTVKGHAAAQAGSHPSVSALKNHTVILQPSPMILRSARYPPADGVPP